MYVDDFKMVGTPESLKPMGQELMSSTDLEPPIALQSNVNLGCRQEPEVPNASAEQQKADIFQGFLMKKHAQDVAFAFVNKKPGFQSPNRDRDLLSGTSAKMNDLDTSGGTAKTVAELTEFFETHHNAKTSL